MVRHLPVLGPALCLPFAGLKQLFCMVLYLCSLHALPAVALCCTYFVTKLALVCTF